MRIARAGIRIERVTEADDALVADVAALLPQLAPHRKPPDLVALRELVAAPLTHLLVARSEDGGEMLGMLTLLLYRIPTGFRGWIHDVVVDGDARGRGIGEALTLEAMQIARDSGAVAVELTTRPERAAANRLYRRLGFEPRDTNCYVWHP
jgi:ribosomal protein S18 acetylase RimI-like enzyme